MSVKFRDKITQEGIRINHEMAKMTDKVVAVGFQTGANSYADGADLVEIATYNEYGSSTTPPRPFIRKTIDDHQREIVQKLDELKHMLFSGATAEQCLKELAVFGKGLMQETIVTGDFEPNAPSTIKRKKSERPLIDTGHMRQMVQSYIKKKGEE